MAPPEARPDQGAGGGERLLLVNAGSSSTKVSVVAGDQVAHQATLGPPGDPGVDDHLRGVLARFPPAASGHRVVHGGDHFAGPVVVGDEVEARLRALAELAPLHNPPGLALLDRVRDLAPGLPAVACFDTTFFADLPASAATFALPPAWRQLGVRRYGFHGLSHAWACERVGVLTGGPAGRTVSAHLGAGASLAAVHNGRAVDTTMGFTPLDGLVMATRSGQVDPGAVTFVLRHTGASVDEVEDLLETGSGLVGLAGTGDLRRVIAEADRGRAEAALAWAVYLHRLRSGVGAMAASLGGLDTLVFTGGAGEASARLRREACAGLAFLGVAVDPASNEEGRGDRLVSPAAAAVAVAVVAAREDLEMARQVRHALAATPGR
ncbi:MAG TPA: acetate/propionate family kinase [Acidimicrobiales bacterium]|nr:acetate/propionate family kinase [Acidimicrobiales bacterium]